MPPIVEPHRVTPRHPRSPITRVSGSRASPGVRWTGRMPELAVLSTKIEPPRLRAEHVPRPRLVEQLRQGLHRRLTLIEASAGSGKTTLLVEWGAAEASSGVPFAWLSLDAGDNDPVRFWTYVVAALRRAGIEIPRSVDSALAAPAVSAKELGLPELVNVLAAASTALVLVLDDYHLIHEPEVHEGLVFFL